jgi:hypothetical protein
MLFQVFLLPEVYHFSRIVLKNIQSKESWEQLKFSVHEKIAVAHSGLSPESLFSNLGLSRIKGTVSVLGRISGQSLSQVNGRIKVSRPILYSFLTV